MKIDANSMIITNQELAKAVDFPTLLPIYKKINILIYYKQWDEISITFLCINIPKMSDVLLMGLLRLTWTYRKKIDGWYTLFYTVRDYFDERDVDLLKEIELLVKLEE
jgi:hypothetical protein